MNDRTRTETANHSARVGPAIVAAVALVSLLAALAVFALVSDAGAAATPAAASATQPTVTVRSSRFGKVLFDGRNRALYAFTKDPRGESVCYGGCAAAWPPYIVKGTLRAGTGAQAALLGRTKRRNGSLQLTYAGRPLYYYVADGPGQILCQNVEEFGGLWLVVRGSGRLVR